METKLTLEDALLIADGVTVGRDLLAWPPEFAVTVYSDDVDELRIFRGFPSRSAAWDAVEAVSPIKRPIPKPDQELIDNTTFPFITTLRELVAKDKQSK